MKFKNIFLTLCVFFSAAVGVQAGDERWQTNFEAALEQAKAENKSLLLNFTGSDWCPPCMYLHETVLSKDAFHEAVSDYYVLVELDYPQRKVLPAALTKQNEQLGQIFRIEGYPTLILFSPQGKELSRKVGIPEGGINGMIDWMLHHRDS